MILFNSQKWLITVLGISLLFCFVLPASAKYTVNDAQKFLGQANQKAGVEETNVEEMLGRTVKMVLSVVGIIFFILMFYGGYTWLLARGQEENIKKAQNTIIASCIGLIVIVASYVLTNFVVTRVIQGNASDNIVSEEASEEPKGCCLDRWSTEGGGFFGVVKIDQWRGLILTQKECEELGYTCDFAGDFCGEGDFDWLPNVKSESECIEISKVKSE